MLLHSNARGVPLSMILYTSRFSNTFWHITFLDCLVQICNKSVQYKSLTSINSYWYLGIIRKNNAEYWATPAETHTSLRRRFTVLGLPREGCFFKCIGKLSKIMWKSLALFTTLYWNIPVVWQYFLTGKYTISRSITHNAIELRQKYPIT